MPIALFLLFTERAKNVIIFKVKECFISQTPDFWRLCAL